MIERNKQNLSNAFAASLSFGFNEKEADFSLDKEDKVISKYAGLDIYQPTVENVEIFIRKYVLNELAFFPKILDVTINLIPSSFDSVKKDHLKDATGLIKVKMHNKVIEIPFMVRDAELIPFDVIQMDGQRVPYSRENLRKVILGVDKLATKEEGTSVDSPYVRLERTVNPTTSPGFLGDVLNIQDQHIRQKGNNTYVTAAAKIDEAMEKVASMSALTQQSLKVLSDQFAKKAQQELKAEFEKFAEEDKKLELTEKEIRLFQKAKDAQFVDANSLPNGTVISFPEKDGKDLIMTRGIVVSDYMDFAGSTFKNLKVVITNDGRMRILSSNERFLCFKATDQMFAMPKKEVKALEEGDVIMAFDGNKALVPCSVRYIKERFWDGRNPEGQGNQTTLKVFNLEPIPNSERLISLFADGGDKDILGFTKKEVDVKLATLEGTKFGEMPYDLFISAKSKETGIDEMILSSMISKYDVCMEKHERSGALKFEKTNLVFVTSEDTKLIPIKGVIRNFVRDKSEFEHLETTAQLNMTAEEGLEKFAGFNDTIRVECIDRRLKTFRISVRYTDKNKKMFKQLEKKYDRVSQDDFFAILRTLNFRPEVIKEILFKAKNEPYASYPLPMDSDPSKLEGGAINNLSVQNMKNTVGRFVSPQDLTNAVIAHMIGNMVVSGLKAGGGKPLAVAQQLKKFAGESKALSVQFEKVAMERRSKQAFEVAKLMSLNTTLIDKVAGTMVDETIYPRLGEIASNIREGKDHLEKVATELVALKAQQYNARNEIINPNYIQAAVNQIDNLYKLASAIIEADPMQKEAGIGEAFNAAKGFAKNNAGTLAVGAGIAGVGALANHMQHKAVQKDISKGISSGLMDANHQREDEIQDRIKSANNINKVAESVAEELGSVTPKEQNADDKENIQDVKKKDNNSKDDTLIDSIN